MVFFNWTKSGQIVAVEGAMFLKYSGLDPIPFLIKFIIILAFLNLFIGSASVKWAIMTPIFVPMFILLNFSPELTQAVYGVGDSVTNIISPVISYFALIIAFIHKYDEKADTGTLIATMLPYTFSFFVVYRLVHFRITLGTGGKSLPSVKPFCSDNCLYVIVSIATKKCNLKKYRNN